MREERVARMHRRAAQRREVDGPRDRARLGIDLRGWLPRKPWEPLDGGAERTLPPPA